jgi:hypothetical protein
VSISLLLDRLVPRAELRRNSTATSVTLLRTLKRVGRPTPVSPWWIYDRKGGPLRVPETYGLNEMWASKVVDLRVDPSRDEFLSLFTRSRWLKREFSHQQCRRAAAKDAESLRKVGMSYSSLGK